MIITIDGPSGTGKTTVAKAVARALGFAYFDTGAMYRALTWFLLHKHINLKDSQAVCEGLAQFHFRVEGDPKRYYANDYDVTTWIRSVEVTAAVSAVSALKDVRDALLQIQRQFGKAQHAVFEGRDLGTVVFPEAQEKIFLWADPAVCAERRLQEWLSSDSHEVQGLTHDAVLRDLMQRDEMDSTRAVAPLKCPLDALVLDTTFLSIDQVVEAIVTHYKQRRGDS